jgi:hypothetical protein
MKQNWMKPLVTALLLAGSAYSYSAESLLLTDGELDSISAGGYSEVYGEATADSGTVNVNTTSQGTIKPNGTQVAKSKVVVKAKGSGLEGYAYGESGDENVVTNGEGAAAVDQGRIAIVVKTKVKTKADGTSVSKTVVKSKAVDATTGVKVVSKSVNVAKGT